ncbi:MAG: response regulator [Selenomonadaceae bacterium]|nr:response regulator [Selenomonadaceae bacterium]MBR3723094.1 response regulator [Selenomonadaceae bacterium]
MEEKKQPVILAVDDDEVNLFMVGSILGNESKVVKKSSGVTALKYLAENSVDLVLLDFNMPGMDGIEVLAEMRRREEMRNVPVIIMTGEIDVELETSVFHAGAVDFVRKPFAPMVLRERTKRVLQNEYLKRNLRKEVVRQTRLAEERLAASIRLFDQTVLALVKTIDAKDKYTQGHSQRVAYYTRLLGEKAGESQERLQELYCMGLLHDIGKIGVPGAIINKTSRLTDEEYAIIKSHTTMGAEILKPIVEFPKLSIGARYHHERWDGRGYPDGIAGNDIPRDARLIAVADAYDAMTSRRSYRGVMEQERVRTEIERGRGSQFDPYFADLMLNLIDNDKDFKMRSDPVDPNAEGASERNKK